MVYLDYAANTPVDARVLEVYCRTEQTFIGNPNAAHCAGQAARRELERVTARLADSLGVLPEEIIYTSGATEANNLALKGVSRAARHLGRHILSTPLEHSSVGASLTALQQQGYEIDLLGIGRDGRVDLEQLEELLRRDTVLVAVSAVDSELGTVQPVEEIARLVRRWPNCRLHVDATQAVGKIPLALHCADTVSFTAHKFYGPNGIGALYKRRGLAIEPQINGGASTTLYRSGTPTLALAAAMQAALELALSEQEARCTRVRALHETLLDGLRRRAGVRINSPAGAVPHLVNLSVDGIRAAAFRQALSERGVCVSVKSACSTDGTPSKAVYAVSRDRKNALCSWRVSLSHLTGGEELDEFFAAFDACCEQLRREG